MRTTVASVTSSSVAASVPFALERRTVETTQILLLPFLLQDIALEPGMMLPDGIHPTAAEEFVTMREPWTED